MRSYDLIVIGSGPAGQRAAVQAAKLGKSVVVIDKHRDLGGVAINTGTIPSKTMREAALDLSGLRNRGQYREHDEHHNVTVQDLLARTSQVMQRERDVIRDQLQRNNIQLIAGTARFTGPHDISVVSGDETTLMRGEHILIAVGTTPGLPMDLVVDHELILTSDDVLSMKRLPRQMVIVGGGVIGVEYATIFAAVGVKVTLLDKRDRLLDMVDSEIVDSFQVYARELGVTLRLGEEVAMVEAVGQQAIVTMKSGKRIATELVMVSAGRIGATVDLGLECAGLTADDRGRLKVNEHYQTPVPHIYAAGDCIGFPALASTSAEQGRLAALHAFDMPGTSIPELFPFGIYAIPEISWVGRNERDLTAAGVPFETGVARYREIARGHILGDEHGMLKLIFHIDTHKILGVWTMGTQATELVHIGQAVMALDGTLEFFVRTVFNYPTLAECYKVAALEGFNKLQTLGLLSNIHSNELKAIAAELPKAV